MYFDPAPVLNLVHTGSVAVSWRSLRGIEGAMDIEVAERLGVCASAVRKWRDGTRRMNLGTADAVALRLGLHPTLIWPDEWERT